MQIIEESCFKVTKIHAAHTYKSKKLDCYMIKREIVISQITTFPPKLQAETFRNMTRMNTCKYQLSSYKHQIVLMFAFCILVFYRSSQKYRLTFKTNTQVHVNRLIHS